MKILISADMEGITGVVSGDHVGREGKDYQWAREIMTKEVSKAVEGALAGGAKEVVVNDSHGTMRNIVPDLLHPEAQLITGSLKELSMMEGLAEDIDGVFFVGYHAHRQTARAIHAHTYSGQVLRRVRINDKELGEVGVNALVAGAFNVPVLLVTGDDKVCRETEELLGQVLTVAVKKGLSFSAARNLHPTKAGELIRVRAEEAVRKINEFKPYHMPGPYRMEVEVGSPAMADGAQNIPGVGRPAPTTLTFVHDDLITLFKAFRIMLLVGGCCS